MASNYVGDEICAVAELSLIYFLPTSAMFSTHASCVTLEMFCHQVTPIKEL